MVQVGERWPGATVAGSKGVVQEVIVSLAKNCFTFSFSNSELGRKKDIGDGGKKIKEAFNKFSKMSSCFISVLVKY